MKTRKSVILLLTAIIITFSFSCSEKKGPSNKLVVEKKEPVTFEQAVKDWRTNKGIGPITSLQLDAIDETMVAKGQELFDFNCTACHLPYSEKIGPALLGITDRRTPEWIVNMILNPVEMAKTDPICLGLLAQFNTVMADQNLSQEEARSILEYFRTLNIDNAPDPS